MANRLAGKVALVTGGSRGLGRGIAEGFASEGASIIVNYVKDVASAEAVVANVKALGADAIAVKADVGDEKAVPSMVDAGLKTFGKIDIVVNNAGLLNSAPLAEMSVETWDEMIRTHLRGMFLCTRFVIPHMIKQKSGKIINITGTFGISGGADFTHLSAAKAGMIGFTRALAREVGKQGIHVNAIAPAIIRTDLYNFMPESVRDEIVGAYPLGRVGEVEDVVATAMFLATKDSDYFTGQTLCPAGGDVMV
ncbi:MAG: 3-oxoacyl-[acyl-carrier protein] reductase [Alphaproteobacteria bacterium]|jgi:3-oxoacyl-[acyl-carrier protein] reductase|nr:3-oxoacyl-[acyl-carrier protein] reductase [Alphaproteobacteria bacterium]